MIANASLLGELQILEFDRGVALKGEELHPPRERAKTLSRIVLSCLFQKDYCTKSHFVAALAERLMERGLDFEELCAVDDELRAESASDFPIYATIENALALMAHLGCDGLHAWLECNGTTRSEFFAWLRALANSPI
jgi:hypothetical protein